MSRQFEPRQLEIEDYWRGIILLGRNVASYKFALAKTLLELRPASGQLIKIPDLAQTFAFHIATHLSKADKQATSRSSRFLDACRKYNSGELSKNKLIEIAIRFGFNNVIDAFHVVGSKDVPQRFYIDERKENGGIRATDELSRLLEGQQAINLPFEVEARWRLVETAWELGVNRSLMSIGYNTETEELFALDNRLRRKSVTGSRDALNGYQHGKCFYCSANLEVEGEKVAYPEVDHFFPNVLKTLDLGFGIEIDAVWNLVLACMECNRGERGKFAQVPNLRLLKELDARNEFLISSHHPLRETLMQQLGASSEQRREYLNDYFNRVKAALIHEWDPAA